MSKKNGRPRAFSDGYLKEKLYSYAEEHPEGKITPGKLEKETGIKSHIWRDRMKDEIARLNQKSIMLTVLSDTAFEYPNMIAELLDANGNEKKLIAAGERYNNILNGLVSDLHKLMSEHDENYELRNKVSILLQENEELRKACNDYKRIISEMTFDAQFAERSEKYGIRKNLLNDDEWSEVTKRPVDSLSEDGFSDDLFDAIDMINDIDE